MMSKKIYLKTLHNYTLKGQRVVRPLILENGVGKPKELNIADERPWWGKTAEIISFS